MDFCQQIKPLFISMSLFGLIFQFSPRPETSPSPATSLGTADKNLRSRLFGRMGRPTAQRIYCVCVCCLLWLRTVSYIPSFWVGVDFYPDLTSNRLICFVWLLQCSLNVTVMLHGCLENNALGSFIKIWKTLQKNRGSEKIYGTDNSDSEDPIYADITISYCRVDKNRSLRRSSSANMKTRHSASSQDQTIQENSDKSLYCENRDGKPTQRVGSDEMTKRFPPVQVTVDYYQSHKDQAGVGLPNLTPVESSNKVEPYNSEESKEFAVKLESQNEVDTKQNGSEHGKGQFAPGRCSLTRYERIGWIYTVTAWLLALFNMSLTGLYMFGDVLPETTPMVVGLTNPFGTSLPVRLALFLLIVVCSCAWSFPTVFCCALCALLRTRLNQLTEAVTTKLSACQDRFPCSLECPRQEHLRLCQCVTVLDQMVGKIIMTSYATNLPLSVFLLYILVAKNTGTVSMMAYAFWLISNLGNLLLISVMAASVHEAAHSPLDRLFFVKADRASPEQLAQLQLFISKLKGAPVGFTAMGIMTVTKEAILTLGGVLATYFFVVLQFKIS